MWWSSSGGMLKGAWGIVGIIFLEGEKRVGEVKKNMKKEEEKWRKEKGT